MNCISYAIFTRPEGSVGDTFDFNTYLRGLMLNIRLNRLLFPGWDSVIHVNRSNPLEPFFNELATLPNVRVIYCDDDPLCKAMLWRLKPIYEVQAGAWKYEHVICRDVDAPTIYKDAQAVGYWMTKNKAVHAITDSDSHCHPLMGGMCGFKPSLFTSITGTNTWENLIRIGNSRGYNYNKKNSDQDFLLHIIYPLVSQPGMDSITQHYFEGYGNTHLGDYHTCGHCPRKASGHRDDCPNNFQLSLPEELKESNTICGHIGAAGFYEGALTKFLKNYKDRFIDIRQVEDKFDEVRECFWWKDMF